MITQRCEKCQQACAGSCGRGRECLVVPGGGGGMGAGLGGKCARFSSVLEGIHFCGKEVHEDWPSDRDGRCPAGALLVLSWVNRKQCDWVQSSLATEGLHLIQLMFTYQSSSEGTLCSDLYGSDVKGLLYLLLL